MSERGTLANPPPDVDPDCFEQIDWREKRARELDRQASGQRRFSRECLGNAEMLERQAAELRVVVTQDKRHD